MELEKIIEFAKCGICHNYQDEERDKFLKKLEDFENDYHEIFDGLIEINNNCDYTNSHIHNKILSKQLIKKLGESIELY